MILILGGGLAGMSTAYHLGDLPHLVLEAESTPGGLCRTRHVDGFAFDYTGHLLHLRDPRCVQWIDELLPQAFDVIERQARIRTHGRTIEFPFQAHLHGLPGEIAAECVLGFVEALRHPQPHDATTSFETWSNAVLGRGISRTFMFPYNTKLFRRAPAEMTADWVSWAVPQPSLEQVVRGALGLANAGMGYNPTFRYPREGGIGRLPEALAARVPSMRTGARIAGVDLVQRKVELSDGERLGFERLVVTLPLPKFLKMLRGGGEDWAALASGLDWSNVACLNLGIARPSIAEGAHWIYFPDPDVPFYRVGFPSNFSPSVAPPGRSSAYIEFGLRRDERLDPERLETAAIEALYREGLLDRHDEIPVRDWTLIDPGYVIFDRERQEVMRRCVPALEAHGIHLIGRYGAWSYSYMERALLDGLELAQRLRAVPVG